MNSKRTILAAATAALLTAITVSAASAQTQERSSTRMNAGQNLSPGGQTNVQGGADVNAGQRFQGGNVGRNEGANFSSQNRLQSANGTRYGQSANGTRYGMTSGPNGQYSGRHFDRDHRLAYRHRGDFDRRVGYSGRYREDGDRYGYGGWNSGRGGPGFDVSVGYGGWGAPGYGYDYGYPGLYSYAPGYVGVGFGGGGCSCGGSPGWGW